MSNINYNNSYYQYYRNEKEMNGAMPEIVYSHPIALNEGEDMKKADYEYYPEIRGQEEKTTEKKHTRKKIGKVRLALIFVLCIAISCLSTVLATDIMTSGEVIAAFKSVIIKDSYAQISYNVAYIEAGEDYDKVKEYAATLRGQGYGGYATLVSGGYRLYLDISDKQVIQGELDGKQIITQSIVLKTINKDAFEGEISIYVEEYAGYGKMFLDYMGEIITPAQSPDADEMNIRKKSASYAAAYSEYISGFINKVKGDNSIAITKIVSDMNINLQAMYALAVGGNSPNIICDARYYALNAVFNYNNICEYIDKMEKK